MSFIFISEVFLFLNLTLSLDRWFQHFKKQHSIVFCLVYLSWEVASPFFCSSLWLCVFPLVLGIVTLFLFLPVWMWCTHMWVFFVSFGCLGLLYIDLYPQPMKSYLIEDRSCCKSYFFKYFQFASFLPTSGFQSYEQ